MATMYESVKKEIEANAKKARDLGLWFYCIKTKHWLTPEEFEQQGKANLITYGETNRTLFLEYHMSDPKEGVRARIALAKRATIEAQEFTEKVFAYFNQVAKDKP